MDTDVKRVAVLYGGRLHGRTFVYFVGKRIEIPDYGTADGLPVVVSYEHKGSKEIYLGSEHSAVILDFYVAQGYTFPPDSETSDELELIGASRAIDKWGLR